MVTTIEKVTAAELLGDNYTNPPDLFPQAGQFNNERLLKKYIQRRLIELAREGKLSITDILNQDKRLWQVAGAIILGHTYQSWETRIPITDTSSIPMELRNYTVKIRTINGHDKIRWKIGMVESDREVRGSKPENPTYQMIDQWANIDGNEAELFLSDAWMCLRQFGKFCKVANSASQRKRYWKYEEIPPTEEKPKATKGKK
jgi:hypothetical protein